MKFRNKQKQWMGIRVRTVIAFGRGWVSTKEGQPSEVRAAFCIFI